MKSLTGLLVIVVLLAVAGTVLWFAGRTEERRAAAEYTLVTLRYERAAEELSAATGSALIQPVLRRLGSDASDQRPMALYWSGDYESITTSEAPGLEFLAANAEYRALRRSGGPWQTVVGRLDTIAKRYADILRVTPTEDAAYNYEFVLRLRGAVVRAKQPLSAGDPGADLTVHGAAGAPPQDSDAKKFKMIVPMLPDERQEAEEAGRAGQKVRKG
jgi:hypothetical protein